MNYGNVIYVDRIQIFIFVLPYATLLKIIIPTLEFCSIEL